MTTKEACALYRRAGKAPPAEPETQGQDKVRGTRRKVIDGINFRSTLEARVYQLLKLWEAAGEISGLEIQPLFVLQPKMKRDGRTIRAITYRADFAFIRGSRRIVGDAKGYRMEVYRMKAKMLRATRRPAIVFEEWTRATLEAAVRSSPELRLPDVRQE
jgi:hypothetical protein